MTKLLLMLKEECEKSKVKNLRKRGKFSDQYETPGDLKQKVFYWKDLTKEEVFDICLFMKYWKNGINYNAFFEE